MTSTLFPLLRRAAVTAVVIVSAAVLSGCSDGTPTSPAPTFSQTDIRAGSGIPALAGHRVSVYYTGWLYDPSRPEGKGLQFETNVGAENPLTFTLGAGQVIAGWDSGILNQRVGGLRLLVIPASLAYGGIRNGPIPADAALVFEVDLISAEPQ